MKSIAKKELVIGASVIVAIVVLFFGIDYLKGINLLNPTNFYYADYENVSGLEVSAPVNVNGYKVGQVRSIEYDYDNPGHIKVLIAVNSKLKVPEDSHAVLASTLLSGGYVDLQLGTSKNYLKVGSNISTKASSDLMEAVSNEIMPAVEQILPKVDSLLANLNKLVADPALQQSIQRFDGITANVLGVTEGLNTTMSRDVPFVMRNAKSLTTKIDTVSYNLVQLSHSLRQLPLSTTIDNVNAVTANLEAFSNQLNDKNSTLGLLTSDPELYNRLNRVSADVDSLIVDIKKNPKRYISIKLL